MDRSRENQLGTLEFLGHILALRSVKVAQLSRSETRQKRSTHKKPVIPRDRYGVL